MIWDVSFGLNKGLPTVLKMLKSPLYKLRLFNRRAPDVKPDFHVSWQSVYAVPRTATICCKSINYFVDLFL
jgi:hypothetical protein